MKIGFITKPNTKGQVVIPKEIRDSLGIDENVSLNLVVRGKGIYIYPIIEVIRASDRESSYVHILKKTKGAWYKEDSNREKGKKDIELKASKDRKHAW